MRLDAIRALRGPNVHHPAPSTSTSEPSPGLVGRLLAALPGLENHRGASEQPGGVPSF